MFFIYVCKRFCYYRKTRLRNVFKKYFRNIYYKYVTTETILVFVDVAVAAAAAVSAAVRGHGCYYKWATLMIRVMITRKCCSHDDKCINSCE